jgi:VanZ family protein
MSWLPKSPKMWLAGFILWFSLLSGLSAFSLPGGLNAPIDNFDKIAHFGFFFGGSGLLCAYLYRRNPEQPNWPKLILTAIAVIALIGALDEFHQSFTPGRYGNDPMDWLADLLGATAGALTFKRLHHLLK